MKSTAKRFFCRGGCVLLLAAFVFAVTSDPITDAVVPHDDCAICIALAHAMAPGEPGPVVTVDLIEIDDVVEIRPLPILLAYHSVYLSRAPPVS